MSRSIGTWGEAQVANYLRQRKFRLVAHSYRCRFGEIDLIAMDGNTLCFVEVKTRRGDDFGYPAEAVNETKQRRMQAAARYYMHMNRLENVRVQFDVVEIEVNQISNCI